MNNRNLNKIEKKLIIGKELTRSDIIFLIKTIRSQKQIINTLENIIKEEGYIIKI